MAPVATNAIAPARCAVVMNATSGGAIIAPRLDPLLQTPMASVRASGGTQIATALANAGHAPPSPTASRLRKNPRLNGPRAKAVEHPGAGPPCDREREAAADAEPVEHPAGERVRERVGDQERVDDRGVVAVAEVELGAERRRENGDDLAVDEVDRGLAEQQGDQQDQAGPREDGPERRRSFLDRLRLAQAVRILQDFSTDGDE